jgi:hypothetical protein
MSNLTIVTGLWDIKRSELNGFGRSFQHYLDCFARLLTVEYPMVIYVPTELVSFIWEHRRPENTRIIVKELEDLKRGMGDFDPLIQNIRQQPEWRRRAGWIPDSPQSQLEYYNLITMQKQFFLNDATLYNFFDTKHYLWVDAGISNTIGDPAQWFNAEFGDKVAQDLNKMLYVAFPYDGDVEVHGFEKNAMNRIAGKKTEYVCRGGIFGGPKHIINDINDKYYGLMNETLNAGLMGTEESLFTILSYRHPEKCNVQMIDSNGLVVTYLNRVREREIEEYEEELAIYVLTYNFPEQFKMWAESMDAAHPNTFKSSKKYVINNSTDKKVARAYKALFKKYDFVEHKFDNIGINDGRRFASDHFLQSNHKYMVFFEDDMLLHAPGAGLCKNGFGTYYKDLFEKAIEIVDAEQLDYLKLSHSEFYGDNHKNWAWENVPKNRRDTEFFPERENVPDPSKVTVFYTGSHKGLPFAVGEYHFCNWPIIFTKKGSHMVFDEVRYEHLYEQTLMSQTFMHMRDDKLRVGSLLATTINHNRIHHYPREDRKENKYG